MSAHKSHSSIDRTDDPKSPPVATAREVASVWDRVAEPPGPALWRRRDAGYMIAIEAAARFLISAHLHPAVVHTCNKVTTHRCRPASMPVATSHRSPLSRPPRPRRTLSALSPTQLRCPLCRLFRRQAASQPIAAGPDRRSVVHTGGDPAHARLQRRGWRNPGDLSARADQGNRGCHRHQKPVAKHFECATRPGADGRSRRPGAGSRRRW
jgi:hypothetical protein